MPEKVEKSNAPRNYSTNLEDIRIYASGILAIEQDAGLLSILTQGGHYGFLINREIACQIVQQAREFIKGDRKKQPKV